MQPLIYIVDVGQGACNIVVLGKLPDKRGNRAILLDCGPKSPMTPLEILKEEHVEWIEAIVVSHNDSDHYGGLKRILAAYKKRIGRVYYVADRPAKDNTVRKLLSSAFEANWIKEQPRTISIEDAPSRIFPLDKSVKNPTLQINALSPQGHELEQAKAISQPNEASAVLILKCGKSRLIFPGDATIPTWEGIVKRRNGQPIPAEVLVIPHHGGRLSRANGAFEDSYSWLLAKAVNCTIGIISAGTNNRDKHPREEVLSALYNANVRVVCTEATESCAQCNMNTLLDRKTRQRPPSRPSYSILDAKKVPCMGTIVIDVRKDSIKFVDSEDTIRSSEWPQRQQRGCPLSH